MPEVILPCPNPKCRGHAKGVYKEYSGGPSCHYMYSVKCCGCGVSGPERREKAAAISAWNSLPRALHWTHEPPKVAGPYYVRQRENIDKQWSKPRIVSIKTLTIAPSEYWQFAGPIAPPVE